ncbi:MAG: group II intron reverse transcriptase/maturase, partial [Actinobacteria bacterium]|nr:group II intron reverse transcriptase/maturase [Actinomycetota bacterium]
MSDSLFNSILSDPVLHTAWTHVRANAGAPGIDRVSVEDFEENLQDSLNLLKSALVDGSYQPLALKTFTIKKESGSERILHIPAVRDRIVEQAIVQVLQPVYEKIFHNCSYAYRPGRSAHKALERVQRNLKRGREWILNLDIENFFDSVDRDLLMHIVQEKVKDNKLLAVIRTCLDSFSGQDSKGIAQGLPLSPLLSNVYLHKLDDRLIRAQWNYIRYSDNILVLDKTEEDVKTAFAWIREELAKLKLTHNEEKTEIVPLSKGFSFLGFHFDEKGKRPDDTALHRLNRRVGGLLGKAFEYTESQMREKLDAILRGWLNYFKIKIKDKKQLFAQLDETLAGDENSIPKRLIKATLAYQLGEKQTAREIIRTETVTAPQDAELNFQWGVLCDMLGLQNEALDSFLAAFRLQPDHTEATFHLGLYYLRRHQHDQAIRYLQKTVQADPNNALYQFTLGTALQNYSLHGAAQKSLQKAYALDPKLKKATSQSTRPLPVQPARYTSFSQKDVETFIGLFDGREGIHARQWLSDEGKNGYSAIRHAINADDARSHFKGDQTLGIYIMRADNTVKQLVFDIDVTRQVRNDILAADDDMEEWRDFAWNDAKLILAALKDLGLTAYIEDSGFKGMHAWLFFAEPQPAYRVIRFAHKILARIGPPPPGLHREIFPNQNTVSPNALGALIKLPMGIHKTTNRRCHFLTSHGEPSDDPFELLRTIKKMSSKQFLSAIEGTTSSLRLDKTKINKDELIKIEKIFAGCNVLRYLQSKAEKEKRLSHIDRLTLLGVFGHIGEAGRQKLHELISHTLNYDFRITEKWFKRCRGYPVSCPKIRVWQSDITPAVGCYCTFPDKPGNYPSPLLHADPDWVAKIKKKNEKKEKGNARAVATDKQKDNNKDAESKIPAVKETIHKKQPQQIQEATTPQELDKLVQDFL